MKTPKKTAPPPPAALDLAHGRVEIIQLDPTFAELLLSKNHPAQRRLDPNHAARIKHALEIGKFLWTGDPIRIDAQERLIDGQHRCSAVVQSGITIPDQILIHVLNPDAIQHIDVMLKRRTISDLQRMRHGKSYPNSVTSGIVFEHHEFVRSHLITLPQKLEIIYGCEYLEDANKIYNLSRTGIRFSAGAVAGIVRALRCDRKGAHDFFGAVAVTSPLVRGVFSQQAQLLIKWLTSMRGANSSDSLTHETTEKVLRTFLAWQEDRPLLKLVSTGTMPQLLIRKGA